MVVEVGSVAMMVVDLEEFRRVSKSNFPND